MINDDGKPIRCPYCNADITEAADTATCDAPDAWLDRDYAVSICPACARKLSIVFHAAYIEADGYDEETEGD